MHTTNGLVLIGASIGIASAMAASKLNHNGDDVENVAKTIASTFLSGDVPSAENAIDDYVSMLKDGEIATAPDMADLVSVLSRKLDDENAAMSVGGHNDVVDAKSSRSGRTTLIRMTLPDVLEASDRFHGVMDKWQERDYDLTCRSMRPTSREKFLSAQEEARKNIASSGLHDDWNDSASFAARARKAKNDAIGVVMTLDDCSADVDDEEFADVPDTSGDTDSIIVSSDKSVAGEVVLSDANRDRETEQAEDGCEEASDSGEQPPTKLKSFTDEFAPVKIEKKQEQTER